MKIITIKFYEFVCNDENHTIQEFEIAFGGKLYGYPDLENPMPGVRCSCTGNTTNTAHIVHFVNGKIICPKCGAVKGHLTKKGWKEYNKYIEEKENEPLCLEPVLYDWEALGQLYGLNKRIPHEEWLKIKQYMRYITPSDFEDIGVRAQATKGWVCMEHNVDKVRKILGIDE